VTKVTTVVYRMKNCCSSVDNMMNRPPNASTLNIPRSDDYEHCVLLTGHSYWLIN